jgi:hypothetical protein
MDVWEQARTKETVRLCEQTIERIEADAAKEATRLLQQVKDLRRELVDDLHGGLEPS